MHAAQHTLEHFPLIIPCFHSLQSPFHFLNFSFLPPCFSLKLLSPPPSPPLPRPSLCGAVEVTIRGFGLDAVVIQQLGGAKGNERRRQPSYQKQAAQHRPPTAPANLHAPPPNLWRGAGCKMCIRRAAARCCPFSTASLNTLLLS